MKPLLNSLLYLVGRVHVSVPVADNRSLPIAVSRHCADPCKSKWRILHSYQSRRIQESVVGLISACLVSSGT